MEGLDTWAEITDHDVNDEISYIVNELRSIKSVLIGIKQELNDLYYQRREQIYKEGTNIKVR